MITPLFILTIGSHFFKCTQIDPRARPTIVRFANKFVQFQLQRTHTGRYVPQATAVYAARTKDRSEYRFNINCLPEFKQYLITDFIPDTHYLVKLKDEYESEKLDCAVQEHWKIKDEQIPYYDYLVDDGPPVAKFLGLQTGYGKTFISMLAATKYDKRIAIVIRPMYIQKWISDVLSITKATKEDLLVIRGGDSLMGLLKLQEQNKLKAKFIIISNTTMANWFKEYEEHGDEILSLGYPCLPEDLYSYLKVGLKLVDEVHQDLKLNNKLDLYTHVKKSYSLSATLLSRDPFIKSMQDMMFPPMSRCKTPELKKYINTFGVFFRFLNPNKIRATEFGSKNYSHNAFEQSIMKNPHVESGYYELINFILNLRFIESKREKKRCLIFCYTQEMCEKLRDFLRIKHSKLIIEKYVSGDDKKNILESDICISTLGSAGAALDIPDLTTVILTNNVDSIQSSIQSLGRLRILKDNHPVEFYYLCCTDIPKHREYSDRRIELFKQRAASFKPIFSNFCI